MRNIFSTCIYHYVKQISVVGSLLVEVIRVDWDRGGVVVMRGDRHTSRIGWSAAKLFMRILVCCSL